MPNESSSPKSCSKCQCEAKPALGENSDDRQCCRIPHHHHDHGKPDVKLGSSGHGTEFTESSVSTGEKSDDDGDFLDAIVMADEG